jgi:hypothetical protein
MTTKTKIKIAVYGTMPKKLNTVILKKWKSQVFELVGNDITTNLLPELTTSNGPCTDDEIKNKISLKNKNPADFTIAIVNINLEDNYYSRRVGDNCVIFSFSQISEHLKKEDIPLENAILRAAYVYTLVFRANDKVPSLGEEKITHDETRKCIFDHNAQLYDIVETLDPPCICPTCENRYMTTAKIDRKLMSDFKKELSHVRKPLYFRIRDLIREKPITAFVISSIYAVILGTIGSLIASYVWEYLRKFLFGN